MYTNNSTRIKEFTSTATHLQMYYNFYKIAQVSPATSIKPKRNYRVLIVIISSPYISVHFSQIAKEFMNSVFLGIWNMAPLSLIICSPTSHAKHVTIIVDLMTGEFKKLIFHFFFSEHEYLIHGL